MSKKPIGDYTNEELKSKKEKLEALLQTNKNISNPTNEQIETNSILQDELAKIIYEIDQRIRRGKYF